MYTYKEYSQMSVYFKYQTISILILVFINNAKLSLRHFYGPMETMLKREIKMLFKACSIQ